MHRHAFNMKFLIQESVLTPSELTNFLQRDCTLHEKLQYALQRLHTLYASDGAKGFKKFFEDTPSKKKDDAPASSEGTLFRRSMLIHFSIE